MPHLLGLVLREAIPSWKKACFRRSFSLNLQAPSGSVRGRATFPSGSRHLGSSFAFQVSAWHSPTVFFSSRLKKPRWVQALPPPKTFPPRHAYGQDELQRCSIQQVGDANLEWWWTRRHAALHAGTPFREKTEEAEQGGQKWLRALR